jgi:hypothetical protein
MVSTLLQRNHREEYTEAVPNGGPWPDETTSAVPRREEQEPDLPPSPSTGDPKRTEAAVPRAPADDPVPDSTGAGIESPRGADICRCEVIEVLGDDVLCWVEVAAGLRVKTSLAISLFHDFRLEPGVEFCWSTRGSTVFLVQDEDEELAREIEHLDREWHEDLKHRDLYDSDE